MRADAKILSAKEAVALIPANATLAVGGFVGAGHPELLTAEIEKSFLSEGRPSNLTLVYAAGQGDRKDRGLNHLAHPGLIKRVVGGHWNLAPQLGRMALENRVEAYNLPQGVICHLLREIAAKRPGVFTKIGLNTFIDPRQTGGKMNACTTEDLVELIELDGELWLRYRSFPITVGLIRGTYADARGNITMDHEGLIGDCLPIAQAAKNHGGIVIAQVEELVERITDPKAVRIPGILVDAIVVAGKSESQWQTFGEAFNPAFVSSGEMDSASVTALEFSERRVVGCRVLQEIPHNAIVNLGIGFPEAVAAVAAEKKQLRNFTLTLESGPIGGVPASGLSFGCSRYPEAILDQPAQFDFYDGGGLDFSALGAVEIDAEGNVCVHQMAGAFAGVGGFVNISQTARKLVFCFSFTAGGLEIASTEGRLHIVREGKHRKFIESIPRITFHAASALERRQEVLYVSERAVFRLQSRGLELVEIAPGVDLQTQILDLMPFRPIVNQPSLMPASCFIS